MILGYIAMIVVGGLLGLLGGGGAILTLPVMIYFFNTPVLLGTSYSLFIVGSASLLGAWRYHQRGLIDYRIAAAFAIPSLVGLHITRQLLLPAMPDPIFAVEDWVLSKSQFVMIAFAIVMIAASVGMIRPMNTQTRAERRPADLVIFIAMGILVGCIAGLVGAGGGFLIIPALVVLAKIPMTSAIGTSLLVIAVNSLLGFLGDVWTAGIPDWWLLLSSSALALTGVIAGSTIGTRISAATLKPLFGWFVLIMAMFILVSTNWPK